MLCAYHTVNEKQGGKSKVRLVRGKKKKKKRAFSSRKTEEDTEQKHLGIQPRKKTKC